MKKIRVGILGASTWGMALARKLSNIGHEVQIWSAIVTEIDVLTVTRRQKNLPYMVIPDAVEFTKNIADVCNQKDILDNM